MLPKWSNEYSVHNFMIDEQHKKLFELANMADNMIGKQTDPVEIKKILVALFEYMRTHFHDEEAYMQSINFPYLSVHKEHHREIVTEMTFLIKNMKYDFKQQLAIITEQWLLRHILQEDMGYAKYLEETNRKRMQKSATDVKSNEEHNTLLQKSVMETKKNVEIKKGKMHMYTCLCGKTYNISPDIHAKIQAGDGVKCPECTTFIKFVADIEV